MKRKEFIKRSAFAMAAGLPFAMIIQSCGSDDSADPEEEEEEEKDDDGGSTGSTANCLENGTTVDIGSNHGHSLTVSKSDVESASTKTYSIQGGSGHNHQVTISSSNFQQLQQNKSITVNSNSGGGHTHSVSVSCA
ncbi:MAG: hypothetical protein ABJG78_17740 [Cyclobacteriaceae bacterium]